MVYGTFSARTRTVGRSVVAAVVASAVVTVVPATAAAADADAYHRSGDRGAIADFPAWMSWVDGTQKLTEISIPASHQTMSYLCPTLNFEWCNAQSMSLAAQLNSGIRFLDVRARVDNNDTYGLLTDDFLRLAHGGEDFVDSSGDPVTPDKVFVEVCDWLWSHSSETVVIRLSDTGLEGKHDNVVDSTTETTSEQIVDIVRDYHDRYQDDWKNPYDPDTCVWDPHEARYYNGEVPLLDEVRGRIVLMIGGDGTGGIRWNDGAAGDNSSYHDIGPSNVDKEGGDPIYLTAAGFDNHLANVTGHLVDADATVGGDVFYLSQLNANGGGEWYQSRLGRPLEYAGGGATGLKGMNERLVEWFLGLSDDYAGAGSISKTGVVYLDFPDESLIGSVIAHNIDEAIDLQLAVPTIQKLAGPFAEHAGDYQFDNGADDRLDRLDRAWRHFIDHPGFQSAAFKNQAKGSSYSVDDIGVEVASGWVADVRYVFWLSTGAVPISDDVADGLRAAADALTVSSGAGAIRDDMVSQLRSRFPDHGIAVLVKEQPYDEPNDFAYNPLPDAPGIITYQGGLDWQIVAWMYDPPLEPTASFTGPTTANEGDTIWFDGSSSTSSVAGAPLSYCWTWTGGPPCDFTGSQFGLQFFDEWSGDVTLTVDNGYATDSTTTRVEFANVAPRIDRITAEPAIEGRDVIMHGELDDPGLADEITADISWGDGTTAESERLSLADGRFDLRHPYADDGQYTVTVTPFDGTETGVPYLFVVDVLNVAPKVLTLDTPVVGEGETATWHGTVADLGDDTFTASVYFDDGTSLRLDPLAVDDHGNFEFSRVFGDDDPSGTPRDRYGLEIVVTDDEGANSDSFAGGVWVENLPPDIEEITLDSIEEGSAATITVTFTHPGPDTFVLDVDWGDGTPTTGRPVSSAGDVTFQHVYADDPTGKALDDYLVTVAITDDDGGETRGVTVVSVENVAPEIRVEDASGDEGSPITLSGTLVDPGDDRYSAVVDWGDGSPAVERPLVVDDGRFELSHVYRDDDPTGTPHDLYDVTITISDDDGGNDTDTVRVGVRNVAPSVTLDEAAGNEGVPVVVTGRVADPGTDTFTAAVSWGDGESDPTAPIEIGPGGRFSLDHVYADDGAYRVEVVITDDDGGTTRVSTTLTIRNVPPNVAIDRIIDARGHRIGVGETYDGLIAGLDGTMGFTVDDVGVLDTHTATVDWGDGSTDTVPVHSIATITHRFDEAGARVVVVTVEDDDDGVATDGRAVSVSSRGSVLAEMSERLDAAIADASTGPETIELLSSALDALARKNRSALGLIDSGRSGVIAYLIDAASALDAAGWDVDAEQLARLGAAVAGSEVERSAALADDDRDAVLIDQARRLVQIGNQTTDPVEALSAYERAETVVKKVR